MLGLSRRSKMGEAQGESSPQSQILERVSIDSAQGFSMLCFYGSDFCFAEETSDQL